LIRQAIYCIGQWVMRRKPYFQATSYRQEKRRKGSVMVGVLVGIVIGVVAVVSIALYLNYVSTPFTNMSQFVDEKKVSEASGSLMSASSDQVARSQSKQLNAPGLEPPKRLDEVDVSDASAEKKFDFYKILPGDTGIATEQPKKLLSKNLTKVVRQHYLQVGSFRHAADANNLKAKLALIGISARIWSTDVPNQGLVHRVRIGPINLNSIEPMKVLLRQNGIQATVTSQ